jgi:glycosyltransferase involved in cell wall biosynthesis
LNDEFGSHKNDMIMIRLSIIVPIYNVEKYLAKCLNSLLVQDISSEQYEIIVVNDGSTDNSSSIAELYVNKYPNVTLYSQKNKGLGAARNTGIHRAKGNCLFFVDSDDYIRPNSLGQILNCFETKKLDALRFNYEVVNDQYQIIKKKKNAVYNIIYSEKVVDGETFMTQQLGWACYVWVFLFESSFIKNNHFFFNENIYFEDVEWLVRVMMSAKRIQSINQQVYFYLQRTGSITQGIQIENKNKIISDKLYVIDVLKRMSETTSNRKVVLWCKGMISLTFMGMLFYVENDLPQRKEEIIEFLKSKKYLPLKSYHFTLKQQRDLFIINLSPRLYCYLRNKK